MFTEHPARFYQYHVKYCNIVSILIITNSEESRREMASGLTVAPLSNRLFFSYFLILTSAAVYIGFFTFHDRTEFSLHKIQRHYLGSEDESFDPEIVVESEETADEGFFFPKTYKEVLSVTHVHLFMMPLILFVLSRILTMTLLRRELKIVVFSVAFAGTIFNISGPWLIMYISPHLAIVLLMSYVLLGISFPFFIVIPLYEMWFKPKVKKRNVGNEGGSFKECAS